MILVTKYNTVFIPDCMLKTNASQRGSQQSRDEQCLNLRCDMFFRIVTDLIRVHTPIVAVLRQADVPFSMPPFRGYMILQETERGLLFSWLYRIKM
jgi:hypothetical protein